LFDNDPLTNTFCDTFFGCSGLTGPIPANLFSNNAGATIFWNTFKNCSGLTGIPLGLFTNNTLVTNFTGTFNGATGITSAVPKLWNTHPGAEHNNCFRDVVNASNYGVIPADWK
jgi:hypothetical protein